MLYNERQIDATLLERLREGDKVAFETVFNIYHRYLFVVAHRYLMSELWAEDAVQYTFLRLWEERENFDYSKGVKNLLFTILKNHILNQIRHKNMALQKNYEMAQMSDAEETCFLKDLENEDFKLHFYDLINELPEQKRKVCLLKIEEGLSNKEVAQQMHITVPTVKSHYTQAIKLLRSKIGKLLGVCLIYGVKIFSMMTHTFL